DPLFVLAPFAVDEAGDVGAEEPRVRAVHARRARVVDDLEVDAARQARDLAAPIAERPPHRDLPGDAAPPGERRRQPRLVAERALPADLDDLSVGRSADRDPARARERMPASHHRIALALRRAQPPGERRAHRDDKKYRQLTHLSAESLA